MGAISFVKLKKNVYNTSKIVKCHSHISCKLGKING